MGAWRNFRVSIDRIIQFLRVPLFGLFLWVAIKTRCTLVEGVVQGTLLLLWMILPLLFRHRHSRRLAWLDFVLLSELNLLAVYQQGVPLYFSLYGFVALESALWWGWPAALSTGVAAAAVLAAQGWVAGLSFALIVASAAITLGWSVLVGIVGHRFCRLMKDLDKLQPLPQIMTATSSEPGSQLPERASPPRYGSPSFQ